jgi:arginase
MILSYPWYVIGIDCSLGSRYPQLHCGSSELVNQTLIEKISVINQNVRGFTQLSAPIIQNNCVKEKGIVNREILIDFGIKISENVANTYSNNMRPMIIGGDHSLTIFSFAAAVATLPKNSKIGLLWIDAHSDINTPDTSERGTLHGMSVAHLLGFGDNELVNWLGFSPKLKSENLVYLGLRSVDKPEKKFIHDNSIQTYTMKDIDIKGIGNVIHNSLNYLNSKVDYLYISFDIDVIDPLEAPSVGTPVRGGITFREAHTIMEVIAEQNNICGIEIVEYATHRDPNGITKELVIGLIESALGSSII